MTKRLLFTATSAVFLAGVLNAQNQAPLYTQVLSCVKVEHGKNAEFRQFVNDGSMKIAQVRADSGKIYSWTLLRNVMPAGTDARCDFTFSTVYEGAPPAPVDRVGLADALKTAGLKMTAMEYVAKRDSVSHLVAQEMWRMRVREGSFQKGQYLYLNHMKVHDGPAYTKFETEVWHPLAKQLIEEGGQSGWIFATKLLPSGTDTKYMAYSADVFPNWDAAVKNRDPRPAFKKAHPDKNYEHTMENLPKLRDLAERELLVIEERITRK